MLRVVFIHFIANINQIKIPLLLIRYILLVQSIHIIGIGWYEMGTKAHASDEGTKCARSRYLLNIKLS